MQKVVQNLHLESTVYQKGKFKNTELYGKTSPIMVQVINEKPDTKYYKEPIELKISGNNITLSNKELAPLKTTFDKTISLRFANIIITVAFGFLL